MKISRQFFGFVEEKEVWLFTISNNSGASIRITNYGATWVSAVVPDKNGNLGDVILGYDNLNGYLSDTNYMGSTVGRFANRINQACFTLDNKTYFLDKNDGENTNHGGYSGFNSQVFDSEIRENAVVFSLKSPNGEGGFPGNVHIWVFYFFSDDLRMLIRFRATTDQDTVLNLTNHAYFNLAGSGNILKHQLQVPSTEILETNEHYIPTGRLVPVIGTPFDFTRIRPIGERINENNRQLIWNRGYNHCYPISSIYAKNQPQPAATLFDPVSGRRLRLFTTLPSVLVYSAGFLESKLPGKSGANYNPVDGICLEAQFYPDSPNYSHFPSCLLKEDDVYDQTIEFQFSS